MAKYEKWLVAVALYDEGIPIDQIAEHFETGMFKVYSMITFGRRLQDRTQYEKDIEDPPLRILLSTRSWRILVDQGALDPNDRLSCLWEITDFLSDAQLLRMPGFGRKSLNELRELRALI